MHIRDLSQGTSKNVCPLALYIIPHDSCFRQTDEPTVWDSMAASAYEDLYWFPAHRLHHTNKDSGQRCRCDEPHFCNTSWPFGDPRAHVSLSLDSLNYLLTELGLGRGRSKSVPLTNLNGQTDASSRCNSVSPNNKYIPPKPSPREYDLSSDWRAGRPLKRVDAEINLNHRPVTAPAPAPAPTTPSSRSCTSSTSSIESNNYANTTNLAYQTNAANAIHVSPSTATSPDLIGLVRGLREALREVLNRPDLRAVSSPSHISASLHASTPLKSRRGFRDLLRTEQNVLVVCAQTDAALLGTWSRSK